MRENDVADAQDAAFVMVGTCTREMDGLRDNVEGIDKRLREVERGQDRMSATVESLDYDINNHGKDGLKTTLIKFIERQDAVREEREKYDAERAKKEDSRYKSLTIWLAALAVVVSIAAILVSIHLANHGELYWPKLGDNSGSPAYAHRQPPPVEVRREFDVP